MYEKFINFIENNGPKYLTALIIFVVGIVIVKYLLRIIKRAFNKSKLDPIFHKFLFSFLRVTLYILLFIITLATMDVEMTSLVALLSVAGLAVSLAVQNVLANVAGGFILLFSKPFDVGDYVEIEGVSGTVMQISIIQTKLLTFDNKAVFIPNGQVSEGKIINFSEQDTRRVDLQFSISYQQDFEQAKAIISTIIKNHALTLDDPAPIVRVCELSSSSVNIALKVWVKTDNYWDVYFDLIEMVKKDFDKNNIEIPFDQLDVNLKNS